MKIKVIILLLILPYIMVGQEFQNPKKGKVNIGVIFSPDYCYRILKPVNSDSTKWLVEARDDLENARFGYTSGLSMLIKLNNKLILESGVLFSDKGEMVDYQKLRFGDQIHPRLGFIYSTNDTRIMQEIKLIHRYQYLDIPFKFNYYIINNKMKIFVSVGVSTNIFIAYKVSTVSKYNNGDVERNTYTDSYYSFNSINFALLGGLGLDYNFSNKLSLRLEPTYRRSINTIIDAPIEGYLYSIGLNAGVYYHLVGRGTASNRVGG